jgi:hypothetical protein
MTDKHFGVLMIDGAITETWVLSAPDLQLAVEITERTIRRREFSRSGTRTLWSAEVLGDNAVCKLSERDNADDVLIWIDET